MYFDLKSKILTISVPSEQHEAIVVNSMKP